MPRNACLLAEYHPAISSETWETTDEVKIIRPRRWARIVGAMAGSAGPCP